MKLIAGSPSGHPVEQVEARLSFAAMCGPCFCGHLPPGFHVKVGEKRHGVENGCQQLVLIFGAESVSDVK